MELILDVFKKLNVDQTVFIQFAILVVIFFLLKSLFFSKLQFVLELRESKTTKLEENANKKFSEAENLSVKYKKEIDNVYLSAQEKFHEKKTEILKSEKETIKRKEGELDQLAEEKRKLFTEEIESKSVDILKNADELATSLVNKIVQ